MLHSTTSQLCAALRKLEQLIVVESGLWFCGPQADAFRDEYGEESILAHIADLQRQCEGIILPLEKKMPQDYAVWKPRLDGIFMRRIRWHDATSQPPEPQPLPDRTAWRSWIRDHHPHAPHLPERWKKKPRHHHQQEEDAADG